MEKIFLVQIYFSNKSVRLHTDEAKKDLIHATDVIERLPHVFYIGGKPCLAEWSFNPAHTHFINSYELPQTEKETWLERKNFNFKSDLEQFGIANLQILEY